MNATHPVVIDLTGADIHAEGTSIRQRGEVARIELPGGVSAWSITGYEAAKKALVDPRLSRDARKHWQAWRRGEIDMSFPLIGWALMDNLTTTYGTEHTRLRKPLMAAFSARRVEAMRDSIERATKDLLDVLHDTISNGGTADLRTDFAHPLTVRVLGHLFGVPADLRSAMVREIRVDTTVTPEEAAANVRHWIQLMHEFVQTKRAHPGDDLTSDLIAARHDDGSQLSDDELARTLHFMQAAGTVPTMNLICNATLALLTDQRQADHLRSERASWDDVIEETLRAEAPVAHLPFRFAVTDIDIDGVTIPAGEPILMNYAAIGRDPLVHGDDAHCFDATRRDKKHLSFGHGIHRCVGTHLARLEAGVALPALFERFPGLTLAVQPHEIEPEPSSVMNGVRALPVRLGTKTTTPGESRGDQ